jgi:hypothetical protein
MYIKLGSREAKTCLISIIEITQDIDYHGDGSIEIQFQSGSGYSVELLQPAFSITPERFNAIGMILAPS